MIAIVYPSGVGDILLATGVLKYRDQLWPKKDIVWYCDEKHRRILAKINGIREIRTLASSYNDEIGRCYGWPSGDEQVFVPCPWMHLSDGSGDFPPDMQFVDKYRAAFERKMSARILGPWRPCLEYSSEDEDIAKTIVGCLPYRKTVMLEVVYNSGQSFLNVEILSRAMKEIRRSWGNCNFVFISEGYNAPSLEENGIFFCSKLPLNIALALFNRVDAFVGVNSGPSCAVCSWAANPKVPKFEIINSPLVSLKKASMGPVSSAFNEGQLFEKLPMFLAGKYDFVPPEGEY